VSDAKIAEIEATLAAFMWIDDGDDSMGVGAVEPSALNLRRGV
jgi:hypothetical protein